VHRTRGALVVVAFAGVVTALAVTIVGIVLADVYRPHAPGVSAAELPDAIRRSDQLVDWHRFGSVVLVVTAVVCFVLVVALTARMSASARRKGLLIGAAAFAVVMSAVTMLTQPLVEWDQLALWAVTVESEIDGYWTAAFGGEVRFVLRGTTEVSQSEYAAVLVVHLAAPAIAAVVLLFVGAAFGRARDVGVAREAESTS
jgi:hypothetical protein